MNRVFPWRMSGSRSRAAVTVQHDKALRLSKGFDAEGTKAFHAHLHVVPGSHVPGFSMAKGETPGAVYRSRMSHKYYFI